jgi:hydroxymethylbilane synthase
MIGFSPAAKRLNLNLSSFPKKITIASRESKLALWQAEHVRDRLREHYPDCDVAIRGMTTRGDQMLDRALSKVGGKGLFVKELEVALEKGEADIAVHSMKDVPMTLPAGFALIVAGEREDPRDAFVSNKFAALSELPAGARVGTSSLRRESQIRARFPRLEVLPLRGNVETRLRKLDDGQYEAIILAAAGLKRLGLADRITRLLAVDESIPAVGQGALGIEYRSERADVANWLTPFVDADNAACVTAERALSRKLAGSCEVPLGGYARVESGVLTLNAFVAQPDGTRLVRAHASGDPGAAQALGETLGDQLLRQGAADILAALGSGT